MRLVERRVHEGTCDFIIEAPTPALAAGILLTAHKRAFKQCSNLVTLPDGLTETQSVCRWSRYIGAMFVIENSGLCKLLDEAGREIEEVTPEYDGATADEQQRNAQGVSGPEQAGIVEPSP